MTNIRMGTAKLLKDNFQIDPSVTEIMFQSGFLRECECRKVLIKDEYDKKVQPKEKQFLKEKIASKYCVSVELVRKIVEK